MRVLLSIQPEYAEKILNGTKRFEYRKAVTRNESVRTVVIYATMPVGKVVGEFEVGGPTREAEGPVAADEERVGHHARTLRQLLRWPQAGDGDRREEAEAVRDAEEPEGRLGLADAAPVLPVPRRRSRRVARPTRREAHLRRHASARAGPEHCDRMAPCCSLLAPGKPCQPIPKGPRHVG